MKQVIRRGLKEIIIDEVPDPLVTPHHVLVRPHCSLISSGTETASIHTDGLIKEVSDNPRHLRMIWEVMKDKGPVRTAAEVHAKFSEYAVLGYSGAGVVVDMHPSVTDLEIRDRVSYGGEGTGHGETILTGRNLVARIPDNVSFEDACFATLGSIALNAVRTATISLGDVVVVIGLGLVGQLIAQLARLQGAVVIATDLKRDRVDLASALGASHAVQGSDSAVKEILALTNGKGADCVIIAAAAKSSAPCLMALEVCRDRGRMVVVGAVEMTFPWGDMYMKEIQLFMSRAYGPGSYDANYERKGQDYPLGYVRWTENRNMEEFLRLVATGQVHLEPLRTHEFPLERAAEAYSTILNPGANSLAVVLRYPDAASESSSIFTPVRRVQINEEAGKASELRIALVGAGNLARWAHLPNLRKIPNARLHAVYSASGARGKSYGRRFGASYCCSDYDEILRDSAVDVVLIVSRNQYHAEQAVAALRAGKHVFLEKPMALTQKQCLDIYEAVEESGKQLTVGFNRRFAPFYVEQKQQLEKRSGPVVINCRVNSPGISGSYWMADPGIGGAILGEACHFVDLMYWLLESEPLSVSAYSLPTNVDEPIGENNLVACFRFSDGSIGNLTYCTVGSKQSAGERVEVFAQGLGVETHDFKHFVINTSVRKKRSSWWADKGYMEQLQGFLHGIHNGIPPAVSVVDGARATVVCLCMLEAARTAGSVQIALSGILSSTGEIRNS
jgi:predicted dehydrogenase/threonine dehydrogenase-like Zn-dependent dehydrogenase